MGFVKKAVDKKKQQAKAAAKAKVVRAARSATPGRCNNTSTGRHQYRSQFGTLVCKCGRVA